jgi:hypothetical protein
MSRKSLQVKKGMTRIDVFSEATVYRHREKISDRLSEIGGTDFHDPENQNSMLKPDRRVTTWSVS